MKEFLFGTEAIVWLVLMIVFIVIEAMTAGLTTIWFAAGAVIAMIAAIIGCPIWLQIVLFFIVSIVLLATTRKILVGKMKMGSEKTNTDALIGEKASVIMKIAPLEPGRVRVKGLEWAALAEDPAMEYNVGDVVEVAKIEGVKLIVK